MLTSLFEFPQTTASYICHCLSASSVCRTPSRLRLLRHPQHHRKSRTQPLRTRTANDLLLDDNMRKRRNNNNNRGRRRGSYNKINNNRNGKDGSKRPRTHKEYPPTKLELKYDASLVPDEITEPSVGITQYRSTAKGFRGIVKQRYSDFIVNEIDLDGTIARLTSQQPPQTTETEAKKHDEEDEEKQLEPQLYERLQEAVGADQSQAFRSFVEKHDKNETFTFVLSTDVDKKVRTTVHQTVRKLGVGVVTKHALIDDKPAIVASFGKDKMRRPKQSGPEYLKFVLHKINTTSHNALDILASAAKKSVKLFSVAGTKDKRGLTSQFVVARYVNASVLLQGLQHFRVGDKIAVGNFSPAHHSLHLGDLSGNRFTIVLRYVDATHETASVAVEALKTNGFINYFGMQRFGNSVPTHITGIYMLKKDWGAAVGSILMPRLNENAQAAEARLYLKETRDINGALGKLPRFLNIERAILQTLVQHGATEYQKAMEKIPRNTRSLYIHAYQSYVWNFAASIRLEKFDATKPIVGDLVYVRSTSEHRRERHKAQNPEEDISFAKVKVLTDDDVKAGTYSIDDIVLPLPGFDVTFPSNEIGQAYKDIMARDGVSLDMFDPKAFTGLRLAGDYRHVVVVPEDVKWDMLKYSSEEQELARSDYDEFKGVQPPASDESGDKTAIVVSFNLPSSCYATMCLRELLKTRTGFNELQKFNKEATSTAKK